MKIDIDLWNAQQKKLKDNLEERARLAKEFFERYDKERPQHLCFDHEGFEGALFYAARSFGVDAVFRYIDQVLDIGIEFTF